MNKCCLWSTTNFLVNFNFNIKHIYFTSQCMLTIHEKHVQGAKSLKNQCSHPNSHNEKVSFFIDTIYLPANYYGLLLWRCGSAADWLLWTSEVILIIMVIEIWIQVHIIGHGMIDAMMLVFWRHLIYTWCRLKKIWMTYSYVQQGGN